jgi:polysaccharide deacetylase 2 family uncharacterized protein YibQ
MRKRSFTRQHLVFLCVAIVLMVLMDGAIVAFKKSPEPEAVQAAPETISDVIAAIEAEPVKPAFAPPLEFSNVDQIVPPSEYAQTMSADEPAWRRNAIPTTADKTKPRVVIIIDDMGMDRKHTRAMMDLPGPLTFAFLPYAGDLKRQTEMARSKGHELMVHMPMEPMNQGLNAGPEVLKTTSTPEEFEKTLADGLNAFDGYVGINNHMGSRMTQDHAGMKRVMVELKKRGLLFVDSKTISTSVAEDEAKLAGIPYAARDVFLDHEETSVAVHGALDKLEREALKSGLAIAIGHPKEETLNALRAWLPTLQAKGITLIPISAAVIVPVGGNETPVLEAVSAPVGAEN